MPKREDYIEPDLVSKFDDIIVKPALKIPPEDLAFCLKLDTQYREVELSLSVWTNTLEKLSEQYPAPDILAINTRYNGDVYIIKDWVKSKSIAQINPFSVLQFQPAYSLLYLDTLKASAEDRLYKNITEYFNNKYNLRLSSNGEFFRNPTNTREYKREVGFVSVVEWVLDECGGIDFENIGFENLKEEFRKDVGSSENVEVTSKKITIHKFLYTAKDTYGNYTWGSRGGEATLSKLRKYITYYEVGELGDQVFDLRFDYSAEPNFLKAYELESTTKIKSIKFFKNAKIEIRFNEVGQEKEFFNTFEFFKL